MRARHRKSVYLNIRVTRDLMRKISQLRRALKHDSVSDTCRGLFELGIAAHMERVGLEAHAHAERERLTAAIAAPERPPSQSRPAIESEKAAA